MLAPLILVWPAAPGPARAAATRPAPDTLIQGSTAITVYLPVVHSTPTPEQTLIDLINAERSRRGLNTLQIRDVLMQVAEAHSQDMADRCFFGHLNPEGQDPGDRLDEAGYSWLAWGETIGAGQSSSQIMYDGWMSSPDHQAILLNPNYLEIGIGYVAGGPYGHYWTAVVATPR